MCMDIDIYVCVYICAAGHTHTQIRVCVHIWLSVCIYVSLVRLTDGCLISCSPCRLTGLWLLWASHMQGQSSGDTSSLL